MNAEPPSQRRRRPSQEARPAPSPAGPSEATPRPPVALLHGLARTQLSMAGLGRSLRRHGHATWACTYPSRRYGVDELARRVADALLEAHGDVIFDAVTHSLGGVLVRQMAGRVRFRRVVMLAPPNAGSDLARALHAFGPFSWLYGPVSADVQGGAAWHPALDAEVAVVAGTRAPSLGNPISWLSASLGVFAPDRPNDGTVAVDETHLPGMTDFCAVDASHTWIMNDPRVQAMVLRFLAAGRLGDPAAATPAPAPAVRG